MSRCAHPDDLTWIDQAPDGTPVWGCEGCGYVGRVPARNGHHSDVLAGLATTPVSVLAAPAFADDDPF